VVVGHGRATPDAVMAAIRLAHRSAAARVVERVQSRLAARVGGSGADLG